MKWKRLSECEMLSLRTKSSLNYYDNKLYLLGGQSVMSNINMMACFDILKKKWKIEGYFYESHTIAKHKSVVWKGYMIVFGGAIDASMHNYGSRQYKNSLFIYKFKNKKWKKVESNISSERIRHSMNIINDKLFIVGGQSRQNYSKFIDTVHYGDIKGILSGNNVSFIKIDINIPCFDFSCSLNNDIIFVHSNELNNKHSLSTFNVDMILNPNKISKLVSGFIRNLFEKYLIKDVIDTVSQFFFIDLERKSFVTKKSNPFYAKSAFIRHNKSYILMVNSEMKCVVHF